MCDPLAWSVGVPCGCGPTVATPFPTQLYNAAAALFVSEHVAQSWGRGAGGGEGGWGQGGEWRGVGGTGRWDMRRGPSGLRKSSSVRFVISCRVQL